METKQTTPPDAPAWAEEMRKWQQEDEKNRAILCIAADNGKSLNALLGSSLELTAALFAVMLRDDDWTKIADGALKAKKDPIAAHALAFALHAVRDKGNQKDKGSIKSVLAELFETISQKLKETPDNDNTTDTPTDPD